MKKIKFVLMGITIIAYLCLSIFSFDILEKNTSLFLEKTHQKAITLEKIDADKAALNKMQALANEQHVLLSVTQRETKNSKDYDMTFVSYEKMEDFKQILTGVKLKESPYILPKSNSMKDNSHYNEFLGNNTIGYGLLSTYWETHDASIPITVHYNKESEYDSFITNLSEQFSLPVESLEKKGMLFSSDFNSIMRRITIMFYVITFIIMLAIGVMLAYELTKRSKEIAIKKLNGYENKQLIKEGVLETSIVLGGIAFVSTIISLFLFRRVDFIVYYLTRLIPIIIFELVIFTMIYQFLLKKISISEVIKQKKMSTKVLGMNYVLKFVLLISITSMFVITFTNYSDYQNKINKYENFSVYGSYLSFQSFAKTSNTDEEVTALNIKAYQIWDEKQDGLYSNFACANNGVKESCGTIEQFATININYLIHFKDSFNGINTDDFGDMKHKDFMIVLVPSEKRSAKESIVKDITMYDDIPEEKIKFIEYDSVTLPTLSYQVVGDGDFTVKNPIIYVINDYYYNKNGPMFYTSFSGMSNLRFDAKGKDREIVYEELVSGLNDDLGYELLKLRHLTRIDSNISKEISSLVSTMTILGSLMFVLFLFYIILEFTMTKMIIEDDKKEISVKVMSGYNSFEIIYPYMKDNLLILLCTSILTILILSLLMKFSMTLILLSLGTIAVIEFLLTVLFYKSIINKKVIQSLKGEQ